MAGFRLTKSSNSIVGLELDAGEARAVEIQKGSKNPTLTAWGRVALPPGAVSEGNVQNVDAVSDALRQLWVTSGISSDRVVLGIANQGVIVRTATFPRVPDNKMAQVIRHQAQDFVPMPLASAVLDYAIIDEGLNEGSPGVEVLLVAARKEMINNYIQSLSKAKLKAQDINVSPIALLRVLPPAKKSGAIAIVNLSNAFSSIIVSVNGIPRLVRLIPVGLEEVAQQINCSLDNVVSASYEASPDNDLGSAFAGWGSGLAAEIRASLTYFQGQKDAVPINEVILSGRGARIEGISAQIEETLGIPTTIVSPLTGISIAGRAEKGMAENAPDFAVSIALAQWGTEVKI
ncbi:MAG: type IV pilus biogenesis protein PilM [Candidatus Saccharibacteria bacterium]